MASSAYLTITWDQVPLGQAAFLADAREGETQRISRGPGSALSGGPSQRHEKPLLKGVLS